MAGHDHSVEGVELDSEFATVVVGIDRSGDRVRLRIHDKRSGATGHLDAEQMRVLVAATRDQLDALVDPAHGGDDVGSA